MPHLSSAGPAVLLMLLLTLATQPGCGRRATTPRPAADPKVRAFIALLGTPPPPAPLRVKVLSTESFPTYTRKLIEYGTVGKERVQAYLLVPTKVKGKAPGILAIHQSGGSRPYAHGKSEPAGVHGDPELAYGRELCERGYVVICPDRFPFESRSLANSQFRQAFADWPLYTRSGGKDFDLSEDLYAGCLANTLLFQGWSEWGKELFELQRAVDVLCAQPQVDPERIGSLGHSAGGIYTALIMYVDPRVKAGCSSCGTFLFRWWFGEGQVRPINGIGSGLVIPGMAKWGDVDDMLAGLAPRPFLEMRGDIDGLPRGAKAELTGKANARYAKLGVPDRFQYVTYKGGHVFRKDMRERSYAWFDRWLKGAR